MAKRSHDETTTSSLEPNGVANESSRKRSRRDAAITEKEARRALKRAKKLAAEKGNAEDAAQEEDVQREVDTKKLDKAARKEEKRRRKAEKAARKGAAEAQISDSITPIDSTSTSTSLVPSALQSSIASPEPSAVSKAVVDGYVEDPDLTNLPQVDIDTYLSTHFISILDPRHEKLQFRPITSFSYLPVTDASQRAPFASFTAPTPIQAAAWPSLLAGRDVIGVAETGSGKTLAFGVPCIRHIMGLGKKQHRGIRAAIVSPTRELALQIHDQMTKLAEPAGLRVVCVYGGVPKDDQRKALKKVNIVVATPGRLNDLMNEGVANLSKVGYLVLDEADRMLDKGFEDDIRKIISITPPSSERQTLMFTATWPESIRKLAATFMTSPVKINIGENVDGDLRANLRIDQQVEVVDPRGKEQRLIQLLKEYQSGKKKDDRILVFCLYKKEATRIENFIRSKGFRVAGIHGDLTQVRRTEALEAFKSGKVPLLVATDVAARGLDIPAVKVVINVTFPLTAEDYVHRIGRTGRAGQTGKAITLFTEHDKALSGALINVLKAANQPVPDELLKFGGTVKKKAHDAYGAFYKDTADMKKATKITFD